MLKKNSGASYRALFIAFLLFYGFFLIPYSTKAQKNEKAYLDSLLTKLTKAKEDTNRVLLLLDITELYYSINLAQALNYETETLKLIKKLKWERGLFSAQQVFGRVYWRLGKFNKARNYHFAALKTAEKRDLKGSIISILTSIGQDYADEGNYEKALEYFKKTLQLSAEKKDKNMMANSYLMISWVYHTLGNLPESSNNQYEALKIYESIKDEYGAAICMSNIAEDYVEMGNDSMALFYLKKSVPGIVAANDHINLSFTNLSIGKIYLRRKNIPLALQYYNKSLAIAISIQDYFSIGSVYSAIGNVYLEQNKINEALKHFLLSAQNYRQVNATSNIAEAYTSIGKCYTRLANYAEARKYFDTTFIYSKKLKNEVISTNYLGGVEILDSALGNWKDAYINYKVYVRNQNHIRNNEKTKKMMQLSMQYEFDKKETMTKAEQEKKDIRQKIIQRTIIGVLLGVLFFLAVVYRQRNKIQKEKKRSDELLTIVAEKQKEIVDSITYAKRLQRAILPPPEFVTKHLPESFIYYNPKDIVAGDFYWAEAVDNLFFIAAADSTGHGVPGAMVSVVCSNALNRALKEFKETETGKILDKTRELVLETFQRSADEVKDGMDISLLCVDTVGKKIFWSGANNSLWHVFDNQLTEVAADKQSIGKTENPTPFKTHAIAYTEGTVFYLFTDGFADQFGGENGKKFKSKKLKELLAANAHIPVSEQKDLLETTFKQWIGNLEQVDDVCIIGVKI